MREMNLFGPSQTADKPGNALAQSDQSRSIAEVQAAMMIARMNPRNQIATINGVRVTWQAVPGATDRLRRIRP